MKNINQKDNFLKRLSKYFDNFLIIDKSVDFILIFIGLLAALTFENYINDKKAKDDYITYLSRIHVELLTFQPQLEDYKKTFKDYESLNTQMLENIRSQKYRDLNGYNKIEEFQPRNLSTDIFRSMKNEFFLNHNLYSELYSFYLKIDEIMNLSKLKKERIQELYSIYFQMKLKQGISRDVNDLIIQFNDKYSQQRSIMISNEISVVNTILKKLIRQIEAEVKSFDKNIDEFKTYEDFLTLSTSFYLSNKNLSINYAEKGLEILSEKMKDTLDSEYDTYKIYNGQFHNNLALAINTAKLNGENLDVKYLEKDILNNLIEWEKSDFNKTQNIITFLHYYFDKKNEEMFLFYFKKFAEEVDNPAYLVGNINKWKEFSDKDTVYDILLNSYPQFSRKDWEYEINVRRF